MAKIFVSLPVLGRPHLKMIQSLYSAIHSCKEHEITIYSTENDSLISRARNVHISEFMDKYTDYDYFVSIDSDLEIVNKFSSNNIFTKLVSHDAGFVGGLYALKQDGERICSSIPMDRNRKPDFNSGLKQMLWLSSGCWCIKREVIEKMINAYPDLTYDGDSHMTGRKIYGLYIPMLKIIESDKGKIKKYLSEDWAFCSRWRDLGGQIFADTSIVLNHYGEKSHPMWDIEIFVEKRTVKKEEQTKPTITLPEVGFDLKGDAL